jgi:hypothetical protein
MIFDRDSVAMAVKDSLHGQRAQLNRTHGKTQDLQASFGSIDTLVLSIRRKKIRNNVVLALTIAACICFVLWWSILSKLPSRP